MKKVTMYIAEDGTQFDNERNCILYEREQKAERQEINNLLRSALKIRKICEKHFDFKRKTGKHPCASCPIWRSENEIKLVSCPFMFDCEGEEIKPYDWGLDKFSKV